MQIMKTEDALVIGGQDLIDAVVISQRSKGLRASGRSAASLRQRVSRSGRVVKLEILGRAYWYQQQNGRRPSRKKPSRAMVASIEEWLKIRGLDIPAYAVAMKIQRDGIRVPNQFNPGGVLSDPLNPKNVRQQIGKRIRPVLINQAKSTFFKS